MILVVDLGSSGVKASVWSANDDAHCALVCTSKTYQIAKLNNPHAIFHYIDQAMDDLLGTADLQISHVGFASFGMSLLGMSSAGDTVAFATYQGELYTFNDKTIMDADVTTLPKLDPGFEERVGVPMPYHSCYAMPHMKRLEINNIEVQRYSTLVSVWLERISGGHRVPISHSEACWWGMYDWRQKQWAVERVGLPQVCDYNEVEWIKLDENYAKRWPALSKAKFHLAVVDGAAATLAAAPINSCVVTVATSAAVRVLMHSSKVLPSDVTRNGCFVHLLDSTRVVIGGSLTDGGSAWDLANTWMPSSHRIHQEEQDMLDLLLNSNNRKPLPICLPFFSGERAPGWRSTAVPGALIGLTTKTTALEIKLSVVIGVGLRLREIYNAMQATAALNKTSSADVVYVCGSGLINSPVWQTVVSAALGGALLCQATSKQQQQVRDNTTACGVAMLIKNQHISHCVVLGAAPPPGWLVQNLQTQLTLQNQYRQRNLL